MKTCSKCKKTKEFEFFDKQKDKKDGYRCHCKACKKETQNSPEAQAKRKAWQFENKEKIARQHRIKYDQNRNEILEKTRLNRLKNKEKHNEKARLYYLENREQRILAARKWKKSERGKKVLSDYALQNKENRKAYMHEYNKSEHGRKMYKDYYHNVRKKNPQFMIAMRIRTQLYERLKKQRNIKRNIPFEECIGCEIPFLETHLKSTMTPEMTWEMFMSGVLVVDHIAPCCSFDLSDNEQLKKCFNYTNLRLIYRLDNSIKAAQDKKLKLQVLSELNPL